MDQYKTDDPRPQEVVRPRAFVVLIALVAALGGLLFGYDTAVITGARTYLKSYFALTDMMEGWVMASALIGCMIGAGVAGTVSDRLGRKWAMISAALLFLISAIGSAIPANMTQLVIARIIGGVGVGMASILSPLYIAEVSPARMRGQLVSLNQLAIVSGMMLIYVVNYLIAASGTEAWNLQYGWRWMFGSETLPAGLFCLLLLLVPESPRWLAKKGRHDKAMATLDRIGGPDYAAVEIKEIESTLAVKEDRFRQLFHPRLRIPLIIGVTLAVLQQVTGINTVMYYAPRVYEFAGFSKTDALIQTIPIGFVQMIFTMIAIRYVDNWGRKPLLLAASAGMGLSLVMLGLCLTFFPGKWLLVFMLIYVAFFAVAMGPIVWVIIAEIFPTRIRGRAMAVSIGSLWIACYAVTQLFPTMLAAMQGSAFYVYTVMCAITFVFVMKVVPETKGKTLEEIERSWL